MPVTITLSLLAFVLAVPPADSDAQTQARAAAVAAAEAMTGDDFDAFKAAVTADDQTLKLWDYDFRQRAADRALDDALIERFGDPARAYSRARTRVQWPGTSVELTERAAITIRGAQADVEVGFNDDVPTLKIIVALRKIDGHWKRVEHGTLPDSVKPADAFASREASIAATRAVAASTRAGKYPTLDAADAALFEAAARADPDRQPRRPVDNATGQRAPAPPAPAARPFERPASFKPIEETQKLINQTAYEKFMTAAFEDLRQPGVLDAAQRGQVAFEAARAALDKSRKPEADALAATVAENKRDFDRATAQGFAGDLDPTQFTIRLSKHRPILTADRDLWRQRRAAYAAALAPAQRLRWTTAAVRQLMTRELEGEAVKPEHQRFFDAAVNEAAAQAAKLPDDPELSQLQDVVDAVFRQHVREILGLHPR